MYSALFLSASFNRDLTNLDPYHTVLVKALTHIINFNERAAAGALNEVKRLLKADMEVTHLNDKLAMLNKLYGDDHYGGLHMPRHPDEEELVRQSLQQVSTPWLKPNIASDVVDLYNALCNPVDFSALSNFKAKTAETYAGKLPVIERALQA